MDEIRSTTPPLPPPASSETLQLEQLEQLGRLEQPEHPEQSEQPGSPAPSALSDLSEGQEATVAVKGSESQAQESEMDLSHQSRLPRPASSKTPEPLRFVQVSHQTNGHSHGHDHAGGLAHAAHLLPERSSTPETPGANLMPFDWDDLEARFEKALASANQREEELMGEFEALIKYFNIWASTASAHDNERASKRLQTRTHYVKLREEDLAAKKKNYEQVVSAFQNAMVLLQQAQT